jgi:hypothetical protein
MKIYKSVIILMLSVVIINFRIIHMLQNKFIILK